MTDWDLIRQYRNEHSQPAFSKLVERHMRMVYWTCRRETSDDTLAEEATQAVFILFAQKAPAFHASVSVSGWLFYASRFVARGVVRSERRRQRHEEEAAAMTQQRSQHEDQWGDVEPLLNDALASLPAADRDAILLRYFEGFSLREVAGEIGTTEDTARKRVSRSLDRMRSYLTKKEVAITGTALLALLTSHAAKAVPPAAQAATLAATHASLSSTSASSVPVLTWQQGAYLLMQASKQKILMSAIAAIVLGAVIAVPIAGWKIYHANAASAAAGHGGFTDLTARSAAKSDPATASARSQIASAYQQLTDAFNKHNLADWAIIVAPNAVIEDATGRQIQTGAGVAADDQRQFATHPEMKVSVTLQSLDIQGDQAVSHSEDRTTMGPDPGSGPGGRSLLIDEKDEIHWQDQGGKWVVVRIQNLGQTTQTL